MNTNFTPGPLFVDKGTIDALRDGNEHVAVLKNPHKIVALTGIVGAPDEKESYANARLFAAAPDLLRALRNLASITRTFRNVPKSKQEWTPVDDAALDEAYAIISKVEEE